MARDSRLFERMARSRSFLMLMANSSLARIGSGISGAMKDECADGLVGRCVLSLLTMISAAGWPGGRCRNERLWSRGVAVRLMACGEL